MDKIKAVSYTHLKRHDKKKKKTVKQSQFDFSEVYRQLRTNIEYSQFEGDIQVVNLTSTNPAEGKSSVASNLATVSIAKYHNVLLMDCDLRKPVQHKIFNVSNKVGLSNLMKNFDSFDVNEDTYFQKFKDNTSDGKLYLLTSGMKVPNPLELLSSEKFKHLIEKLRTRFDFIVIDCPPVDAVADAIPVRDVYKRQPYPPLLLGNGFILSFSNMAKTNFFCDPSNFLKSFSASFVSK